MPHRLRWRDYIGRQTLKDIVKKVFPSWKNRLRSVQEALIVLILNGEYVLCLTATGDGKSGGFSVHILVPDEVNTNRHLYAAGLPTRLGPVGIVVTPTKGFAVNIVSGLEKLGIPALSYCRESLADSRRNKRNLTEEIKSCTKWKVVCVDPELEGQIMARALRVGPVPPTPSIRAADEVHLIPRWGLDFRPAFAVIGLFVRG
ncbi:hypothetical protein C8J57DRAFT_1193791 [Mycena rebaudengoi]|nr:hypothetical protein C8J57DRAFT_1193791 [Mycena rebaudengoi]